MMTPAFAYDAVAPSFDRHRAWPDSAVVAIRRAILGTIAMPVRPRLLDLGAGTGRVGLPFVTAGDDYIGVDLSLGMLREFTRKAATSGELARLVQADGERLPFPNATFDLVLLVQVIGAARRAGKLIAEARRVLTPDGILIVGHTVMPLASVDAQMKQRLAAILDTLGFPAYHRDLHGDACQWLEAVATSREGVTAASWEAERTPRAFLARHRTGARFSALPERVRSEALERLESWAVEKFGSLDAKFVEHHMFELTAYRFGEVDR